MCLTRADAGPTAKSARQQTESPRYLPCTIALSNCSGSAIKGSRLLISGGDKNLTFMKSYRLLFVPWIGSLLLLATAPLLQGQAAVRITEFMASNSRTLQDEDHQYSDWITFQQRQDPGQFVKLVADGQPCQSDQMALSLDEYWPQSVSDRVCIRQRPPHARPAIAHQFQAQRRR